MEFQCFEVKPEEECPLDDKPSTGMFAGSDEHLLFMCTAYLVHICCVVGDYSSRNVYIQ